MIAHNMADRRRRSPTSCAAGRPVHERDEWRRSRRTAPTTTSTRSSSSTRPATGASGVDVVTPLVTDSGAAVLVDRGWMATANTGGSRPGAPAGHRRAGHGHRLGPRRRHGRQRPGQRPRRRARSRARRSATVCPTRSTAASWTCPPRAPRRPAARAGGAARRHQQRPALLLRPAVVVLRGARGLRLLLPRLRRVPPRRRDRQPGQSARSMPPSTGSITPGDE